LITAGLANPNQLQTNLVSNMAWKKYLRTTFLVLAALAILMGFAFQRFSIYHYNVRENYLYDISKSDAKVFSLPVNDGLINLPPIGQNVDTAILAINVKPSFLSYFLQPSIEVGNGDDHLKQVIEHGASGIRYVNLSHFLVPDTQKLNLETHFVNLADTATQLYVFPKHEVNNARILVISPHPDDAEIAAFGLYSHSQSYIATLTAGEADKNIYNEIYQNPIEGHLKKAELRIWDSLVVPLLGGVPLERTVNLGYFDGTLKKMYSDPNRPVESEQTGVKEVQYFRRQNVSKLLDGQTPALATWTSLVSDLAYLLNTIKPDIIVAPYPALDHHSDHKYASIALFAAIKKLNRQEGLLYLYTNHSIYNEYYPYGETDDPVSLPPNFQTVPPFSSIYSHLLRAEERRNKLFALEAMHDLRLDTKWLTPKGAFTVFRKSLKKGLFGYDKSYFRMAVRDNELFFVLPVKLIYDDAVVKQLQGSLATH